MKQHVSLIVLCGSVAITAGGLCRAQNSLPPGNPTAFRSQLNSSEIPSTGASIFYLLMAGISDQRGDFWIQVLQDRSITSEEIEKVRTFAEHAKATNLDFQKTQLRKMCAGKSSLSTLDAVSAALSKFDESNAKNIEQIGNNAARSLGERLGKLLAAAGAKSGFKVIETDHKKLMTEMKKEPVAHINRICSSSSSDPSP
jgi:hypothetical protein